MGDRILHECGLAVLRLRKELGWYRDRYDDPLWGLRRLFLLMEKQHNRGQDGAGLGVVKFDSPQGARYLERLRSAKNNPIERLFDRATKPANSIKPRKLRKMSDAQLKARLPLLGEAMIGHLRYGTHGGRTTATCHPLVRRNPVASKSLALAGNFNLTNAGALFDRLNDYGLHIVGESDTQAVLERMSYELDQEHISLETAMGPGSIQNLQGRELATAISDEINLVRVLRKATDQFDGGWVFSGLLGNGDLFVCRDPAGIRPAFVHMNDEVIAVASERPPLTTVFDVESDTVEELPPGHVLVVKRDGTVKIEPYIELLPPRRCTFERIYFSRGNDLSIYQERKKLGRNLVPQVLEATPDGIENAVFGFVPNTAETAYLGLIEGIRDHVATRAVERIWDDVEAGTLTRDKLEAELSVHARNEKVAHKDQRLRTFITHDAARKNLVGHVYDITRGTVKPTDTLVVLDDSIVRGTTLRESIITMLARLNPKKIVIASSAPPIMYPDCYGIDMSQLGRFIAFEAAVSLLQSAGEDSLLDEVESRCLAQVDKPAVKMVNHVRLIYDQFSHREIEDRISQLVRADDLQWSGDLEVRYQTVDGLRDAMPGFTGDWYFTGDYPTPGGYKVLNTAYLKWRRNDQTRSYEPSSPVTQPSG